MQCIYCILTTVLPLFMVTLCRLFILPSLDYSIFTKFVRYKTESSCKPNGKH
jgi:hypothetical protein